MGLPLNWKLQHPFAIGQTVYLKAGYAAAGLAHGSALVVAMRGVDEGSLWFASALFRGARFSCADFTDVKPMASASDDGVA